MPTKKGTEKIGNSRKVGRKKSKTGNKAASVVMPDCIAELDLVLKALTVSPNFEFAKRLQLTKLLSVESFGNETLDQAVIYDLLTMGGARLYHHLGGDQGLMGKILAILSNFISGDASLQKENSDQFNFSFQRPPEPVKREMIALWSANSTEIEKTISELFQKLSSAGCYGVIKNHLVGDYWDSKWHHYPFLECLTLEQLLGIRPRNLFQKRSFTVTIATYLIEALKKAIAVDEKGTQITSDPVIEQVCKNVQGNWRTQCHVWQDYSQTIPLTCLGFKNLFEDLIDVSFGNDHIMAPLYRAVPSELTAYEVVVLLLLEDQPKLGSKLFKLDNDALLLVQGKARESLKGLFEKECSELAALLGLLLQAGPVNVERLFEILMIRQANVEVQKLFSIALLKAFGCEEVRVAGVDFPGYYSTNLKGVEQVLGAIKKSEPRPKRQLSSLQNVWPMVEVSLLKCLAISE